MTTTETPLTVPTMEDLRPLIEAVGEYDIASSESYTRWNSLKIEYREAHGLGEFSDEAVDYAYAHPSYQPLRKRADEASARARALIDDIEARFPGFKAYGYGMGATAQSMARALQSSRRDLADKMWSDQYRDRVAAVRDLLRGSPRVDSVAAGDRLYRKKYSDILDIVRVTPSGRKIVARSVVTGDEVILGKSDVHDLYRVSKRGLAEMMELHRSHKQFRADVLGSDHAEDLGQ